MKRLIENTVFSGFVIACRFATWPTRISPSFVNPTTEGVRRLPSWLAITVGLPPSTTATTEFVVPRSIPITFAMSLLPFGRRLCRSPDDRWEGAVAAPSGLALHQLDLDLLGLDVLRLGELGLRHAIAVGGLDLVGLPRDRQRHRALEPAVRALDSVDAVVLELLLPRPLALDREHVTRDADTDL